MKWYEGLWGLSSAETRERHGCRSCALYADINHLQPCHFLYLWEWRQRDRGRKGAHSAAVLLPQSRVSLWVSAWLMSPGLPWGPLSGTAQINTHRKLGPEQPDHRSCRFCRRRRVIETFKSTVCSAQTSCKPLETVQRWNSSWIELDLRRQQTYAADCLIWNPQYSASVHTFKLKCPAAKMVSS